MEVVGLDRAGEAEPGAPRADPLARCLLGPGVVLLGPSGDGVEVVLLLTGSELADAQHDRPSPAHDVTPADTGTKGASA